MRVAADPKHNVLDSSFDQQSIKNEFKKSSKNDQQKTWKLMPKEIQNGTKNDAKTHQKSMRNLVTKKIRKIIKKHVSLNGKNIEIHCKNICF